MQTLEEKALLWFNSLPTNSITSWVELIAQFNENYSIPVNNLALLKDLTIIFKKEEESLKDFNLSFGRIKTKISVALRPTKETYIFFYAQALDPKIRYILKDKGIDNLAHAIDTAKTIENNLVESGKKESFSLVPMKFEKNGAPLVLETP